MSKHGNPKLLTEKPVNIDTIKRYLAEQSDFAFEMEILQIVKMRCAGQTSWGGIYYDHNTGKQREYDIRSEIPVNPYKLDSWIELAIECKNIRSYYPLVISCTKRTLSEQKNDLWRWPMLQKGSKEEPIINFGISYERHTLFLDYNDEFVGRALDQVGEDSKGELVFGDEEIFNKWTQALNSTYGMLHDALSVRQPGEKINLVFLPIVVVPDNTLWQVKYDENGECISLPQSVSQLSYRIGQEFEIKSSRASGKYKIHELYFFTKTGLINFLENQTRHARFFDLSQLP